MRIYCGMLRIEMLVLVSEGGAVFLRLGHLTSSETAVVYDL